MPALDVSTFTYDSDTGTIFTCKNNTIEHILITVSYNSTTQEVVDSDNSSQTWKYDYSDEENTIVGVLNATLEKVMGFASITSTAVGSVPATGYFLSFLNFFTMSSLYVLLNIDIP